MADIVQLGWRSPSRFRMISAKANRNHSADNCSFALYFAALGVVAASAEHLATEIRHLQRTEVLEAEEFSEGHRLVRLMDEMIGAHRPDLVVIACNTASTIALPELR